MSTTIKNPRWRKVMGDLRAKPGQALLVTLGHKQATAEFETGERFLKLFANAR